MSKNSKSTAQKLGLTRREHFNIWGDEVIDPTGVKTALSLVSDGSDTIRSINKTRRSFIEVSIAKSELRQALLTEEMMELKAAKMRPVEEPGLLSRIGNILVEWAKDKSAEAIAEAAERAKRNTGS